MALVAYYPLNGDAKDYSGNELHGTATNVSWVNGKVNQAGSFNGTSNINLGNIDLKSTNSLSIFGWVKPGTGWSTGERAIVRRQAWVQLGFANGGVRNLIYTNGLNNGWTAANDIVLSNVVVGQWYHFGFIWNGQNMKTFWNGVQIGVATVNGNLRPSTDPVFIGAQGGAIPWIGEIDEVRIYNHALSEFEIRELALFHPSANLVAHYPLDGDLLDYSGNNFHLTNSGGSFSTGKIKKAFVINESALGIQHAYVNDFYLNNSFKELTIGFWMKNTIMNGLNTVLQLESNAGQNKIAFQFTSTLFDMQFNSIYPNLAYNFNQHLNKWVYLSCSWKPGEIKYYVNGSLVGVDNTTNTGTEILMGSDNRLCIGVEQDGIGAGINSAQSFSGYLEDIRIYSKALSESEIKSLAQAKVAHYKLDDRIEQATQNLWPVKTGNFGWITNQGGTITPIQNTPLKYGVSLYKPASSTTTSWHGTFSAVSSLVSGKYYTVSFLARKITDKTRNFTFGLFNRSWVGLSRTIISSSLPTPTKQWQLYYITFLMNETSSDARVTIIWDYDTEMVSEVCGLQIQESTEYTSFTPNIKEGAIIKDSTYNNNHGSVTLATSPKWSSDTAVGLGSMEFNGTTNKIYIQDNGSMDFSGTTQYTASAWIKPTTGGGVWYGIFSKGNLQQWALTMNNAGQYIHYETNQGGIGALNSPTNSVLHNKWTHVAIRFNGSTKQIFVNGVSVASQVATALNSTSNTEDVRIGEGNTGELFKGKIADVQIFATALSDNDIYNLYTSKSKSIKFSSSSTSKLILDKTKTGTVKSTITK